MAKKDVILRYAQAEHEYLEMNEMLAELKNDFSSGTIDEEYFAEKQELLEEAINEVTSRYYLWAEVICELKKPQRKSKKLNDVEQAWYDTLCTRTRECLKDESLDPLAYLKELITKGQKHD